MQIAHFLRHMSVHLWSACLYQFFFFPPHYIIDGTIFGEEFIEHKTRFLIFEKYSNITLHEIRQFGAELFHFARQTEGPTGRRLDGQKGRNDKADIRSPQLRESA